MKAITPVAEGEGGAMTTTTLIRTLSVTVLALALAAPVAQASVAPPDAFERAVARHSSDTNAADAHQRSEPRLSVETGAPPDWFERAVNIARGDVRALSDSHERSETPAGPSTIVSGGDGSLEWVDLSIGVLLGLALAGLGAFAAFGIRGRGRMAHS